MRQDSLVIVAPNGARRGKQDHPALPVTPDEIALEVEACVEAGAAMVHLHARDAEGGHSLEVADNEAVLEAVCKRVPQKDVVIQLTTEAVGIYQPPQQMALVRALQPEAASFAIKELIPTERDEETAEGFFRWAASAGVISQFIVYSADDLLRYVDLVERGVLPKNKHHLLFVLGRYHNKQQSELSDLEPFLALTDRLGDVRWAVCAFGQQEQACLLAATQAGGDVRVGFVNNLLRTDGSLANNNSEQVSELADKIAQQGRKVLTAQELRAMPLFLS